MKSCLIVNDLQTIRYVARNIFESLSFTTRDTSSAMEALEMCEASMPDLVFADVEMAEMDGYAFTSRLRRLLHGREATVFLCAVEREITQIALCLHSGVNDVILKPFTKEDILERLVIANLSEPQIEEHQTSA